MCAVRVFGYQRFDRRAALQAVVYTISESRTNCSKHDHCRRYDHVIGACVVFDYSCPEQIHPNSGFLQRS